MDKKKPKYFNSWKGQVLKAIIKDGIVTWRGLQSATNLSEASLNKALSELLTLKLLTKHNQYYLVQNDQLIAEYLNYYQARKAKRKIVKDQYHAELVEYVVRQPLFSGPGHQTTIEYQTQDQGTYRYIDVMKWYFRDETPHITIFEIKPRIDDFGATIRQIKYYKSLIEHPTEPNFGAYPEKEILTYLVLQATRENFDAFYQYRDSLNPSDLDFIMFVKFTNKQDKIYPLKDFSHAIFNPLRKWILR
ncbi:MAG: hypothetical protein ACTSQK_13195 [Candidatus Heimdallarchaeota archaeon]